MPRRADLCIPHSENIERFLHDLGLRDRTDSVIRFGIDLARVQGATGSSVLRRYNLSGEPVILYAGVMNEFQRLDLLLEAMTVVVRSEPRAKLLLVVTIPHEKHLAVIRGKSEELGIAENVIISDPQELDSLWEYLAACDVAVVPRPRAPGFPIKLLNYLAAKRPCVMFASSASGLIDREHALLVGTDTSEALGEGILEVLRDADLRERLSRNGYRFVAENHDRRGIARRVVNAYRHVLAMTGGFSAVEEAFMGSSGTISTAALEPSATSHPA